MRQIFKLANFLPENGKLGGYSQIDAVLFLIKTALDTNVEYSYFHYLQGSDLPIQSISNIDNFFSLNIGKEFVNIDLSRNSMAENKCWYRHFFCHNRYFRKNKLVKAFNFSLVYVQKLLHIKKNTDIQVFQGSALFSITKDFARYLISKEREIYKRFRYSLAADECFIQTIIMNSEYKDRLVWLDSTNSSNVMLIDRTRPDGKNSPHIWRESEYDFIMEQAQRNNCLYARKFVEATDINIVKKIQQLVI